MVDKPSKPCDVEFNKDQMDDKEEEEEEERVNGDGEEEPTVPTQGSGLSSQLTAAKGESLSLSSEGSSENESVRSKVPCVNCPEHIVSKAK